MTDIKRTVRPRSGAGGLAAALPASNSLQALPPEPPAAAAAFSTFDFSKRPRSRDPPASPVAGTCTPRDQHATTSSDAATPSVTGVHGGDAMANALREAKAQREKQVAEQLILRARTLEYHLACMFSSSYLLL